MTVQWTVRAAELTEQGCARGESFSSRNIDILLRKKSSNLHLSDAVSGRLPTKVGEKES